MWRWANPDARPVSEYLSDYKDARKGHRFLFYCRECIRNFESLRRIEECPRCGNTKIIELPKESTSRKKVAAKGDKNIMHSIKKARKEFGIFLTGVQQALWRAKIALYYISTPVPEELE